MSDSERYQRNAGESVQRSGMRDNGRLKPESELKTRGLSQCGYQLHFSRGFSVLNPRLFQTIHAGAH